MRVAASISSADGSPSPAPGGVVSDIPARVARGRGRAPWACVDFSVRRARTVTSSGRIDDER
jgi:hypothetical protein